MAGEGSDVAAHGEWEMLSVSASTLGLPTVKPDESNTSAQVSAASADDKELAKQGEESECMQPLSDQLHEDLVSAKEDEKSCVFPGTILHEVHSSKKTAKTSWWKHEIIFGQPQSNKYNAVLSIALVVAVVGIAVVGHRWYRECKINQQLRLELAAKDEKLSDVMQQVKEAVTGRRRVGVTRSSFF